MPAGLLAALSLAQMLASSLHFSKNGLAQPAALSDAISKIVDLISTYQSDSPDKVSQVLTEMLDAIEASKDILPPDVAKRLNNIDSLLTKSQTTLKNVETGQVGELAEVTERFPDGTQSEVEVFAIRKDSKTNVAVDLGLASE